MIRRVVRSDRYSAVLLLGAATLGLLLANSAVGPALIDLSHWARESLWLDVAAEELRESLPGITVTVSETRTDPWDFVIVQSHDIGKV